MAPSQPWMAVSVELLAFYRALFECSCDAINALAVALHLHYTRRSYRMTDKNVSHSVNHSHQLTNPQGSAMQDPLQRSLGRAIQWFDVLQVKLEHQLETAVSECCQ